MRATTIPAAEPDAVSMRLDYMCYA